MVVQKPRENSRQVFSPALANKDWQHVRVQERLDWLYTYDATWAEI